MITIDAHSHYMPPEVAKNTAFFKEFWSDADKQLKLMDENYIQQALLLYPTSDAHINMGGWKKLCEAYNPAIGALVAKHKDRFIGAGILPIDSPEAIAGELKRIEEFGLRVISLASSYNGVYLDDPLFFQVYEFARLKKIPIHVHSQIMNPIGEERVKDLLLSPVLEYVFDVSMCIGKMMMNGIFLKYPEVDFIFAHYGGVLPVVKERFDTTYTMLRRRNIVKDIGKNPGEFFANLYFDTSGSKSKASLLGILEVTDYKHVLWGSDFPANQDFKNSVGVINNSILSAEERKYLCGGNFQRLLEKQHQ